MGESIGLKTHEKAKKGSHQAQLAGGSVDRSTNPVHYIYNPAGDEPAPPLVYPVGFFMVRRAGFYYDGYNLYHAVKNIGLPHLKWLSYRGLSQKLLQSNESLEFVKMFSAIAGHIPQSAARHLIYSRALDAEGVIQVIGNFKECDRRCRKCQQIYKAHEEKESDVNLALHIFDDCSRGAIDVAYIITTDSDLAPAARMAKSRCPNIELVTVRPFNRRHSKAMVDECDRKSTISQQMIERSILPEHIFDSSGRFVCSRPVEYTPPI